MENYDRLDGLGYWALSDLMAEHVLPDSLFFGGLGLFTMNALPKAGFYAMKFLNESGDTLIEFESVPSLSLKIQIDDLEDQTYSISERILNRKNGGLFDIWIASGDISLHSNVECQYLERRCLPGLHILLSNLETASLLPLIHLIFIILQLMKNIIHEYDIIHNAI